MKQYIIVAGSFITFSITFGGSSPSVAMTLPDKQGKYLHGTVSFQRAQADKFLNEQRYADAAQIFQDELKKDSNDSDALAGLGTCLAMQFKIDGSNEQLDKALTINPENALAHSGKALLLLNRLQSSSKTIMDKRDETLKQAEQEARMAVELDPNLVHGHYALGMILKELGQTAGAQKEFQEAIRIDPQYAPGLTGAGLTNLLAGNLPEAIANFRQAISVNPQNSTAHYGLGEALLKQGSTDEAIKELNTSLYQFRNSAPVHLALGKAYETQGNTEAALKEYERAALIKPEMSEANARMSALHIALGKQCEQQRNTVGAFKEYQQAILIDPQNAEPYLRMADLREQRGDLELAIAEMRSGAEINPASWELHERMAEAMLKLGKLDDAINEFGTTLKLQPTNDASVTGLTRALYMKAQKESQDSLLSNDYESAEATLSKAINLHPNDMQLRLALAKLHAISGKPTDLTTVGKPSNDAERIAFAEALLAQNKFGDSATQVRDVIAHTNSTKQLLAVADLGLMIKDLDGAEIAYKKCATQGATERANRGLADVGRAREEAQHNLIWGQDMAKKKQLASAMLSFRKALSNNPRLAAARLGLAETEERMSPKSPTSLRDATTQYRAYLSLSPDLPSKLHQKIEDHAQKLESRAAKIEKK
jgi:tetratricopeptide (TPR) repeat protein